MKYASIGGILEEDKGIIKLNKVILVEGQDEVRFLNALLKESKINNVEVHEVGGKRNFKIKIPSFVRNPGFSDVNALGIIRDADNDIDATFTSIKNTLQKEKLKPPKIINHFSDGNPKIGIFIITNLLEDLCLKTVKKHPAMECVNIFVNCISSLNPPPNNISKAKAQAFLAAMPEIVSSVGLGAEKNYWDFSCSEIHELKLFIDSLKT
jgi:hypothetical protein